MADELTVVLDESSDEWLVQEDGVELDRCRRLEEARARARALLLERGAGSAVIYTPSGRPREKLILRTTEAGNLQVA